MNFEFVENNYDSLRSYEYLKSNELIKDIIKELKYFVQKKEKYKNESTLSDKLLIVNETESYNNKQHLIDTEIFPPKGNSSEVNLEMVDMNSTEDTRLGYSNSFIDRNFKKQNTKLLEIECSNIEEEIFENKKKGPEIFDINTSEFNFINLWIQIKRLILILCILFGIFFLFMIPIVVKNHRKIN